MNPPPPIPTHGYSEPPWAQAPEYDWSLTEIKDGVEVDVHVIGEKRCVLFGRAVDQVDIPLQHESASRLHARIAFDKNGTPWLKDLKSSHGVTVNKRCLPKAAIGREESSSLKEGTRGVVIYPGDVLQFGASTRIFCVEGPAEFARGVIRSFDKSLATTIDIVATSKNQSEQSDDETDRVEQLPVERNILSDDSVPERHLKEWERLKAVRYKLENVKRESERIRVKDELSSGQERQLVRNDERVVALQEIVHEREDKLFSKVFPDEEKQQLNRIHRDTRNREEDVDGDDFFDKTKTQTNPSGTNQIAETEESLITKWNTLHEQRKQSLCSIDKKRQLLSMLERRITDLVSISSEDVFFARNDRDLAEESFQKLQMSVSLLDEKLTETKQLLHITNPRLSLANDVWSIEAGVAVSGPHSSVVLEKTTTVVSGRTDASKSRSSAPREPLVGGTDVTEDDDSKREGSRPTVGNPTTMMPPPPQMKRARMVGPSTMPQDNADSKFTLATGTLALLSSTIQTASPDSSSVIPAAKDVGRPFSIDEKLDLWQAPVGQDGSGITKLNAKYAGRY